MARPTSSLGTPKPKTPPSPPQNTPFPGLILKVGETIYCLGKMDPIWAKCLKSGQNFSRSGNFFLFIRHPPRSVTVGTRSGPSHSQRLAVTRRCLPQPAAGSHCSHSQRPAITRCSQPQSPRHTHSPLPVSLRWRSGPPLLAAACLTDSVTRSCRGAKAEVYVVIRIWNTLIAIFGTP